MQEATRLHQIKEYYFAHKLREVRLLIKEGKPIINLGIGNPDLPPPVAVQMALLEVGSSYENHGYQPYKGIPEYRKAIAEFYKKHYKVSLDPEDEILPLVGSKEGVLHISMAFLNEGDEVLVPNPGYTTYTSVTHLVGAKPIYYDLLEENNWLPDLKTLENSNLDKVKIMWINYPNMPTGANASKSDFENIIAFAKKYNILIINDNPYSFILNETPLSIMEIEGAEEIALELNSLSKSFNIAGWRLGMLIGNQAHLEAVLKVKSNMDSGMYYGLQKGGIAAMQLDQSWFEKLNKTYKKRRLLVWQILDKLHFSYDKNTSGLFVWAKLPKDLSAEEASDNLLYHKNIFVTPGMIFGSNGTNYLRFSLCANEEQLKEVLKRLE